VIVAHAGNQAAMLRLFGLLVCVALGVFTSLDLEARS